MALTSKQRAQLRGLASTEDTLLQIGKDGITDNVIKAAEDVLRTHELVKCRVLENCMLSPREACDELCMKCCANPVQVIGTKFVIYKKNPDKPKIELVDEKKGRKKK